MVIRIRIIRLLSIAMILSNISCSKKEKTKVQDEEFYGYGDHKVKQYLVGDTIDPKNVPIDIQVTKEISSPLVEFKEDSFSIQVSKAELIKSLDSFISFYEGSSDADWINYLKRANQYLKVNENLVFENIWSKPEEFENISWKEAKAFSDKLITTKLLKEYICELVKQGKFKIIQNSKVQKQFYLKRVQSSYGEAEGVMTENHRLIWLCPPYIIE